MRTSLLRTAAGMVVVVALLPAPGTPGAAADSSRVARQAWSSSTPVQAFPAADDRIYVAALAGAEQARAYVELTPEAAAEGGDLVLQETGDGVLAETAALTACLLPGSLPADGQVSGQEVAEADCSIASETIRGADGQWRVPTEPFRARWVGGGPAAVALVAAAGAAPATFRIAFDTAATDVVLPPPADGAVPPAPSDVPAAAPQAGAVPAEPVAPLPPPAPPESIGPDVGELPPTGADGTPSQWSSGHGLAGANVAPDVPAPSPPTDDAAAPAADGASPGETLFSHRSTPSSGQPLSPPAAPLVLAAVAAAVTLTFRTGDRRRRLEVPVRLADPRLPLFGGTVALAALALLPLAGSEVTVYKAGLVLVFLVAAMGMHLLVNWAGQLSLAHAGMIGLPAFVVLRISALHDISPLYLLPVGIAIGAVVGAVVGLPTLRAQGLQVGLVTMAAGVAIDRLFFTNDWFVGGAGGRTAAAPALGPFRFETSRSLYVVLLALSVGAAVALRALQRSKIGRAWFWVRDEPAAAAAFGIRVVGYRMGAYVASGCFAGLGGALAVVWVQHLTPAAFPSTLSLSHLVVAVLSGPGYLGGLAVAALMLEGGRHFAAGADALVAYGGPAALIFTVTRYQAGLNGAGRSLMERLRRRAVLTAARTGTTGLEPIRLGLVAGTASIAAGFVAIGVAWYHSGNTDQIWVQNQELLSGGIGGLALVLLGVGLLIRDRLVAGGQLLARELRAIRDGEPADAVAGADTAANGTAGRPKAAAAVLAETTK